MGRKKPAKRSLNRTQAIYAQTCSKVRRIQFGSIGSLAVLEPRILNSGLVCSFVCLIILSGLARDKKSAL